MIITATFLLVALAAYALFGGADFGGGILEATLRRHPHLQKKIQDTLGPVWEANHVWLIAVIVILFVGFPTVYGALMTHLFVPVSLALVGIILRGAFFTFRKYDPEPEARRPFYSFLFRTSSALTPMMYGMIVASLLSPFPVVSEGGATSFAAMYVAPWVSELGFLSALFVFALFGYVASVFFYGEVADAEDRAVIRRRIAWFFGATFVVGGMVLIRGAMAGVVSVREELTAVQVAVHAVAFVGIPLLWFAMRRGQAWGMRLIAGAQVLCILTGWFATQHPAFMKFEDGRILTIANAAAPEGTIFWLNVTLVGVLAMTLPLLVYLYRVFSASHEVRSSGSEPRFEL